MAFTRVVGAGIHTAANINSHNIKSTGIVTATKFDGPFDNLNVTGVTTFAGSVSIGGTLTYEDVTNIDSVGLVTARDGIFIPGTKKLEFGGTAGSSYFKLHHNGNNSIIQESGPGGIEIHAGNFAVMNGGASEKIIRSFQNGAVELYFNNSKKLNTTNTGVEVTGILTATNGLDAIGIQSGGVNIAATVKIITITYLLVFFKLLELTMPIFANKFKSIGS